MNTKTSGVVEETQALLAAYFETIKGKDFKHFYYDWHREKMYAPFADLAAYFKSNSSKESFAAFVADFKTYVSAFNNDDVKNEHFSVKKYARTTDGSLRRIMDRTDSFAFQLRGFVHAFARPEEHTRVFCDYFGKNNMPYAYHRGLAITAAVMDKMVENYDSLNSRQTTLYLVDSFMRSAVFKSYRLDNAGEYASVTALVADLKVKRDELASWYKAEKQNPDSPYADLFQIEDTRPQSSGQRQPEYRPNGFELEFYYPEQIGNNAELIKVLLQKNSWQKIHTSNKDAAVYHDETSAGVIMPDESLIAHNGLLPAEYASRIMRNKTEERECLKILETFEHGYVNKHCSFHQHISADDMDIPAYKRLLKRMIQHEAEIVSAFAAEERRDSRLLYATYISNNLGNDREKDYPLLCLLAETCDDKKQLREMAGYGRKYKTLNLMPEHTVEFRYMNGHFNRRFAEGFLQFNREMVSSAASNGKQHINRVLLHKYNWLNNQNSDTRTVMKPVHYMYAFAFDRFDPEIKISDKVKDGDMTQARLISHALNKTGKIIVKNPQRYGRF